MPRNRETVGAELIASATYMSHWLPQVPALVWIVLFGALLLLGERPSGLELLGVAADPRFATFNDRAEHREELDGLVRAWCAARISPVTQPRSYDFVEELPRIPSGKLAKHELRKIKFLLLVHRSQIEN